MVVLDADVSASTRTNWVHDRYPDHFYNVGISEQDLVGTAAGLALGGQVPFVSTYGVFLSGRAFDQIRTTVCYNDLHVIFGGAHVGISVGPDGATHQALEDLALARVLPRMTVVAPATARRPGRPFWRRRPPRAGLPPFRREAVPVITDRTTPLCHRQGPASAGGAGLRRLCLRRPGVRGPAGGRGAGRPGHLPPSHRPAHHQAPGRRGGYRGRPPVGAVVTAEEHQVAGGLFGAVSEPLARTCPVPMEAVAVQDTFGESGPPAALMARYGLIAAIVRAVLACLARKG